MYKVILYDEIEEQICNLLVVTDMNDIITIYNNGLEFGIKNRKSVVGRETDLVHEYIDYRKSIFRTKKDKKMAVFIEPHIGGTYPDIVFVEYDPGKYIKWNDCRNELEKRDLKILYHIYSMNGIDLEGLVSQLGVTWKEAGLSIEKLFDSELIIRKSGEWVLKGDSSVISNNIQAVEAKIGKWEEVLQQSIINKNFATESYALIELKNAPSKEMLSKFSRFGVGLCLRKGNEFPMIKRAKRAYTLNSFNAILINEWIGRILYKGDSLAYVYG